MNMKDLKQNMKSLEKFFVNYEGEIIETQGLHEKLAREICEREGWRWREAGYHSCEDFLLEKHGFIKFSNYSALRYVAVSKKYFKDRKVMNMAYKLSEMFNIKIEIQ